MLTFWPLVTDMTTFNKYIDVRLSSGGYFYNARKIKKLYCFGGGDDDGDGDGIGECKKT